MTRAQGRIATVLGFCLAVAVVMAWLDQPIARAMAGIDPRLHAGFAVITSFGEGGAVLYPTGTMIVFAVAAARLWPERRPALLRFAALTLMIFAAVAAAGIGNDILKILFGRARPFLWLQGDETGFHPLRYGFRFASFPSGHSATSFAAAVAFGAIFPRWKIAFLAFGVIIGVSRVALDLHYASDVLAGAAVGMLVASWVVGYSRRFTMLWETAQESPKGGVSNQ